MTTLSGVSSGIREALSNKSRSKYLDNPIAYCSDILKLDLTEQQRIAALSVRDNSRTVIESGHGLGKSILAAALTCWWLDCNEEEDVKAVTFAPTSSHVNNVIWRYIRRLGRGAKLAGRILDTPRWEWGSDKPERFAIGLSPEKTDEGDVSSAQGYHASKLFVLLDECAGLPFIIWENAINLQPTRILSIGNPIEQVGPFWQARNSPSWNAINLSCLDHPNVKEDKEIIPGAVTRKWVDDLIDEHCEEALPGEPNAIYIFWRDKWYKPDGYFQSRVLGIAPTESPDQLISLAWVEAAKLNAVAYGNETIISLDPARQGGDNFAIMVRKGMRVVRIEAMRSLQSDPTSEVLGWFLGIADEMGATKGFIDSVGMGGPILDVARWKAKFQVIGVNSSGRSPVPNKFVNLRAYCYWQTRRVFQKNVIGLGDVALSPGMEKLASDLITPKYFFDRQGRYQIEEKVDIRRRLKRSPDLGDALAISFAQMPMVEDDFGGGKIWEGGLYADGGRGSGIDEIYGNRGSSGGSRWVLMNRGSVKGKSKWRK